MSLPRPIRAVAVAESLHRATIVALLTGTTLLALAAAARAQQETGPDAASARGEAVISAHAFSDLGAIEYGPDFAHLDYVNPDAPKGGEMSTWARGTFDSMNPYSRRGRSPGMSVLPYERLMTTTADDPYASYCLLCETIEYPESQDWVIFNLREDVTFSDGTPMTAEDVKFTHDLFMEEGFPSFRFSVKQMIPEVEVLGPHRIKYHFNTELPRKGRIGQAGATVVFQKKWFEETGAVLDESRLTQPPGTGPYMITTVDAPRRIIATRNPDYWGADLPVNIGRWNFDTIRQEYFADSNAALEAFKAGVYTFRQETSSLTWATQYDFPKIDSGAIVKEELPNGALPPAVGFVFNLRKEKFQDVRVRRALGLMFNFEWTNDTLQYGLFDHRQSFWQNTDLQARGVPEGRELDYLEMVSDRIGPDVLTDEVYTSPDGTDETRIGREASNRARALLRQTGWTPAPPPPLPPRIAPPLAGLIAVVFLAGGGVVAWRAGNPAVKIAGGTAGIVVAAGTFVYLGTDRAQPDDGMLRKDGQTLRVEFVENNPSLDRIILPYIENLRTLGVDAQFSRIDDAQYTDRVRNHDFDMIVDSYVNGLEEANGIAQRFGCEDRDDVFNPAGYCDPAVDALIEELKLTGTLDDMQAGVRAIDRIMRHAYFMVPVWYNATYWVAYYDMFDYPATLPPYDLGNMDFWWYDAEKAAALRASGAL